MTSMFDNTDNTDNTDTIIATCPECNEPIYDDDYVRMCQVKDCHVICHEYDAPICTLCCEFICTGHLTTIDGEDYCPACRTINNADDSDKQTPSVPDGSTYTFDVD